MKKLEDTEADYPRSWKNEETVHTNIPLESHTPLQDRMIHNHKLPTVSEHTQEPEKKIWKLCEESQSSTSRSTNNTTKEDTTKKIIEILTKKLKESSYISWTVIWNCFQ